jgi:hypothetical protein
MNRIELVVAISFQEYWRATLGFLLLNWRLRALLLGAAICVIVFGVLQVRYPYATPQYQLLVVPGALAIAALVIYLNTKSVFEGKAFLRGPVRYVIDDEGITAVAPSAPEPVMWNAIPKAHELKHDFVVFYTRDRMYTLPKSSFLNPAQVEEFRKVLRTRLGAKAHLR